MVALDRGVILAQPRGAITLRSMVERLLCRGPFMEIAMPNLQGRLLDGAAV